jgi:hypothetical protein
MSYSYVKNIRIVISWCEFREKEAVTLTVYVCTRVTLMTMNCLALWVEILFTKVHTQEYSVHCRQLPHTLPA